MANYTWAAPVTGDWNAGVNWTPASAPNDPTANVTIDAPTTAAYTVAIGVNGVDTVNALAINGVNDLAGSNIPVYTAAELELYGTLVFGAGGTGRLSGSLQTFIGIVNGEIINPGTIDGFIQAEGNVLLTGTNGLYVTNWLQSLAASVIIDTSSIAEMTGNTLFDGIFESQGGNAAIYLGGPREHLIVNIATVEGPPALPTGWTELILNGPNTTIQEWNGTTYQVLESTLTTIGARGTVDIYGGRNYLTGLGLTIGATGMLNMQMGLFENNGININGGIVQGAGIIANGVVNNGTMTSVGSRLFVGGALTGTGVVTFDVDNKNNLHSATGSVMEVHGVSAGQTFIMNGDDYLVMDTPSQFAGTIAAKAGDTFIVAGVNATTPNLVGDTLYLQTGGISQAILQLSGNYTGDSFSVAAVPGGTQVHIGVAGAQGASSAAPVTENITTSGSAYAGPVAGLTSQYTNISTNSLDITATAPNIFIQTGSGNDVIDVSGVNGNNVVNAGGGSNFLIGGTGADNFYVSAQGNTSEALSVITNFHAGDGATVFGVNLTDFSLVNGIGAPGSTGLAFAFNAAGQPTTNLELAGFSTADVTSGRLTYTSGTIPNGTASGLSYVNIQAH